MAMAVSGVSSAATMTIVHQAIDSGRCALSSTRKKLNCSPQLGSNRIADLTSPRITDAVHRAPCATNRPCENDD